MRTLVCVTALLMLVGCRSTAAVGETEVEAVSMLVEAPPIRALPVPTRIQRAHPAAVDPEMVICSLDPLIRGEACFVPRVLQWTPVTIDTTDIGSRHPKRVRSTVRSTVRHSP
jgi:hypothetical protein